MAETSLNSLILKIARRLGRAASGAATGGSTTTLIDTLNLYQPNNTWASHYVTFLSGNNADAERLVTASAQPTKTLTLDPALTYTVAAADEYQVLPIERQYFLDAIDNAIASAGNAWMAVRDDSTSLTLTGAQEYSLPTDLMLLYQVWSGDGTYWAPVHTYDVLGRPGAYKLLFRDYPDRFDENGEASSQIRVLYAAALPSMAANKPTDTLDMGEAADRQAILYIQEMALYYIHQMLWSRNPTGEQARSHMSKHQQHGIAAEKIKADRRPLPPAATMQRRRYAEQI